MTLNNSSKTGYLLVDNIQNSNELGDYESKQIITFDYESHVFLTKQKIPHIVSDKFHSNNELHDIENQIHSLVKWYCIESIKNIVTENGINLGELFFLEFRYELVSFLKKFLEIFNLVKLYPNSYYYASENIFEIISTMTKNVTKINLKNKNSSLYDSIDVPLKLGPKQFTIKLSTKNASRIQNFLNKTSKNIFSNKKINETFPTTLLVNFSTLRNEEFLLEANFFNVNIVKYDRTTPAIWNKKSLQIIQNSNCIIENESTLLNKKSKEKINQDEQSFLSKIDLISSSTNLKDHFSLNKSSFWDSIKPLLTRLCKKNFLRAAKEIMLATNLFDKYSFSKILLYNESMMVEQIILHLAKKQKIPTLVLQHGMFYDSDEMINENSFQRTLPTKTDYYVAWGNVTKNFLQKNTNNFKKIEVFGSIFFDQAFQNKITPYPDSKYVLLVSDPLAFDRLTDLSLPQKELYNETIQQICQIVCKFNKKLIIKTHPQKNQHEYDTVKKLDPSIKVLHSGDIQSLIKSAELVIAVDTTTVILEAMILEKPILSIRMKDHYGLPEIFNYCEQINLDLLDSRLSSVYNDVEFKNKLIEKGNKFLKLYFENPGSASKNLLKFLE